jgi:hypothetical protein
MARNHPVKALRISSRPDAPTCIFVAIHSGLGVFDVERLQQLEELRTCLYICCAQNRQRPPDIRPPPRGSYVARGSTSNLPHEVAS